MRDTTESTPHDDPTKLTALPPIAPTLVEPPTPPSAMDPSLPSLADLSGDDRYAPLGTLGVGGMGEVRLLHDRRIGRDVAIKILRDDVKKKAEMQTRFMREARVQGQLEHPAIVPVYDLGVGDDGMPFFTMKRVRGVTLEAVIHALARGDATATARYSRRRLLTAFSAVCLAVDFAHARGVIHRDIKPANIMLGDFGEVHLLDWGIVRVRAAEEVAMEHGEGVQTEAGSTLAGTVIGTPGYMAPEQARGEIETLDARTDVYALGSTLFELLALEALHESAVVAALIATLGGTVDPRPSLRAPSRDIPPELDAVCVRALATDPSARYPTARALAEAIEAYLDGDRDLAQRRALAQQLAHDAREAAVSALRAPDADEARRRRERAMRDVVRALALDPEHPTALGTLGELLHDVPTAVPPEASTEFATFKKDTRVPMERANALRYLLWMVVLPLMGFMGLVRPRVFIASALSYPIAASFSIWGRRLPLRDGTRRAVGAVLSVVSLGWLAGLFGPLIVLPSAIATTCMLLGLQLDRVLQRWINRLGFALVLASGLIPMILEGGSRYGFENDRLVIEPRMVHLPPTLTLVCLMVTALIPMLVGTQLVTQVRDALDGAEQRLFLQAWHLRRFLPTSTGTVGTAQSGG